MKYDTIFFDLDGTLTDSAPGILSSVRYALEKAGAPIPNAETLNKFIGPPLVDAFMRYCGFSHAAAEQALVDYRENYTINGGMFENRVYDGIEQLLARLVATGVKCVVTTSKPEEFSRRILEHFKLAHFFDAIHGATMDESRNRKEDVIAWALTHSGELGRVVMIGDRAQDIRGAQMNGLDSIGALWGYGSREELASATLLAESPAAIWDCI